MADHPPRVGLFGRLGSGNIGNDATLEAVLAYLKAERPDAVLDSLCSGPERVTARYGLPAAQLNWLHGPQRPVRSRLLRVGVTATRIGLGVLIDSWRIPAWVRRHDVVIVPGMGVLESSLPQRPWELPYSQFLMSLAGKVFGTKVAFVGSGATVVRQRLTGWLLAKSAKLASYRSFRDQVSLDAARRMGMAGADDQVYPDLVFALPSPPGRSRATGAVGVGVMAYSGAPEERDRAEEIQAEYTSKLSEFVRRLLADGHHVRLLIGDEDDEPVALEILAAARQTWSRPGEPPVVYESFSSVDELMEQLGTVESVIGTRYHTVQVALKLGKPTVAICYGDKHVALMELMGVGDRIQQIRDLDVDLLERQLTALWTDRDEITRTLAERNQINRERLEAQFAELTAVLFETETPRSR
ncbi:polysaccharide pyruvyl transferase family protein [Kribbella sp. HUAS MG21]|uniref:Polysaccharide pyruvyl transferase family protein n=1 Tax=Kribbella sp. HUAS MG21 TaxID=3160966 RepID=A0AAU7TCY1_9ACTN